MRKEYWVLLFWYVIGTPVIVYVWKAMENRERAWDLLGIWVVNAVIGLIQLTLAHWQPRKYPRLSWIGVYLVLMPFGLMAWLNRSLEMLFVYPLTLVGVLALWFAIPPAEAVSYGTRRL
jgi:hypothetical protein